MRKRKGEGGELDHDRIALIAKEAATPVVNEASESETDILTSKAGHRCLKFSTTSGNSVRGVDDDRSFVSDLVVFPSKGNGSAGGIDRGQVDDAGASGSRRRRRRR